MAFTFKQKVKTIIKLLGEPKNLSALLSQRDFGYLLEAGWFESFKSLKSIDKKGKPIPWFSYPFIDFLHLIYPNLLTICTRCAIFVHHGAL